MRSMVPRAGLEPARAIRPKDFKSFASTYSATPAISNPHLLLKKLWRRHPDSNRGSGICSPMPYRLAMPPFHKAFYTVLQHLLYGFLMNCHLQPLAEKLPFSNIPVYMYLQPGTLIGTTQPYHLHTHIPE